MSDFTLELNEQKQELLAELQHGHPTMVLEHLATYIAMADLYSGLAVPGEADDVRWQLEDLVAQVNGE